MTVLLSHAYRNKCKYNILWKWANQSATDLGLEPPGANHRYSTQHTIWRSVYFFVLAPCSHHLIGPGGIKYTVGGGAKIVLEPVPAGTSTWEEVATQPMAPHHVNGRGNRGWPAAWSCESLPSGHDDEQDDVRLPPTGPLLLTILWTPYQRSLPLAWG